jgi:UDP-2,4-diacetamido-2,4,6-trideoxy-beta-L-altropyranose hydrolase
LNTLTDIAEIGIVVDAGPKLGYGHAVRCVRLARALARRNSVVFYAMSPECKEYIERFGFRTADAVPPIHSAARQVIDFPPLVITDLREGRGISAEIHRHGSRHVSIHDLGLAQCHSDVAIDGAITRLFPYPEDDQRSLFLGPRYMITREPVQRVKTSNTVLVTLGGGATVRYAQSLCERLSGIGLIPLVTRGFIAPEDAPARYTEIQAETDIVEAMSNCCFAISGSGVTLYDLLASGVPTIAVAFDPIQLRTADAFYELGAVLNAGLLQRLSPAALLRNAKEMLENQPLVQRMAKVGQTLVDGKGLSRVVDIVRRQLWLTSHVKTFTGC